MGGCAFPLCSVAVMLLIALAPAFFRDAGEGSER